MTESTLARNTGLLPVPRNGNINYQQIQRIELPVGGVSASYVPGLPFVLQAVCAEFQSAAVFGHITLTFTLAGWTIPLTVNLGFGNLDPTPFVLAFVGATTTADQSLNAQFYQASLPDITFPGETVITIISDEVKTTLTGACFFIALRPT